MNNLGLTYNIKMATETDIYSHLVACNNNFIPPLDKSINLIEYSKKLFEKSVTFEVWSDNILIGLVASYFNNLVSKSAFITNVSVMTNFSGLGIASNLILMCIEYAKKNDFVEINLEVHRDNISAIKLYEKFKFFSCGNKNDLMLMKYIVQK